MHSTLLRILNLVAVWSVCCLSHAIPASPSPIIVVGPDGSVSQMTRRGNAFHHWLVDADGQRTAEAFFEPQSVHDGRCKVGSLAGDGMRITTFPTLGERRALVVLAAFPDVGFTATADPQEFYHRMFNEEGFTYSNGAEGSVRDFYAEASNGRFQPVFDVVGPIMLPHESTYYGSDSNGRSDIKAPEMIRDACMAISTLTDFSLYDNDGDGVVDNVYVFYAGYGQADSPYNDTVWPHNYTLTKAGLSFASDGVSVDHYSCSQELRYIESGDKVPSGIGTFVHEFGHVLGLPDLYNTLDTSDESSATRWDTMSVGSYNNNSNTPPTFSSYERWVLGWLDANELRRTPDGTLALRELQESAKALRITVEGTDLHEYFFIENRQQTGWDLFLPYHGMLIWHIIEDEKLWDNNTVNGETFHHRIGLVEADASMRENDRRGDPFPGTQLVRECMLSSEAGDDLFLLSNIDEADGIVTLDATAQREWSEYLDIFASLHATWLQPLPSDDGGKLIQWSPIPEAEDYTVSVSQLSLGEATVQSGYDFGQRNDGLPQGWQVQAHSYYSVKGYYGQASPSLRLNDDGDHLTVSSPDRLLSAVTFWMRSHSNDAGQVVVESQRIFSDEWHEVQRIGASTDGQTVTVPLDSASGVRLHYVRGNDFTVIDDVVLTGRDWQRTYYTDNTTSECSYALPLLPTGIYGLRVAGELEGRVSLDSEELKVHFDTPTPNGILTPKIPCHEGSAGQHYDMMGRRVSQSRRHMLIISNGKKTILN
ncbi:MAG: M6 family metalloprotease domain-containing protein [Prevotella sp.]|nr:M6 family metalloprotease domain-containing protein [Prevotella sp.]